MKINKPVIISLVLILLLVASAYLIQNLTKSSGVNSAKIIKVTEKGKVVAYISADVLKQAMAQDSEQDNLSIGPTLPLTLNMVGVSDYLQVEIKGKGQKETIVLDRKDVTEDYIIFLVSDGTMNLCKKDDSSKFLIKGITELSITN